MGTSEGPGHGANYAIVQSRVPSDFAHVEREEGGDWRVHIVPPDLVHAEREEGDAWRAHMAIGAQIEEDLSRALNLFSRENRDVNSVSILFAYFRFRAYDFHSHLFIYSSCCPCRGTRVTG